MAVSQSDLLTVAEAARELGVSRRTVQERIARGRMRAVRKSARLWLVPGDEVERWRRGEPEASNVHHIEQRDTASMGQASSVDRYRDWLEHGDPKADISEIVKAAEREFRDAQDRGAPPEVPPLVAMFDLLRDRLSKGRTFEDSAETIRAARDERMEVF